MKMMKYIRLAALPLLMVACQNDEEAVNSLQTSDCYKLFGQIGNVDDQSRAQIQLGNTNVSTEYFFWNENDRFALYQNIDSQLVKTEFVINSNYNEVGSASAIEEFITTDELVSSASYVAIYPYNVAVENNNATFSLQSEIDFTSATTTEEKEAVWKNYFSNNMFMLASGTLNESGSNCVWFRHLCALARITYTNQTGSDQQITGLRLGGNQTFGTAKYYDVLANEQLASSTTNSYELTLKGVTVANNASIDLYMLFFPENFADGRMEISILQSSAAKAISLDTSNFSGSYFQAGCRYWFDVVDTTDGLDWAKNTVTENLIVFTNKELSAALLDVLGDYKVKMNADGFALMTKEHVNAVYELNLGGGERTITSLDGIENFKNLNILRCNGTGLTQCDLSQLTRLYTVELNDNELKELDFSENKELRNLSCERNDSLVSLDIANCSYLMQLKCSETALKTVTITNPQNIQVLHYGYTDLSFNLNNFSQLYDLGCYGHNFSELNLSTELKARLTSLQCYYCEIDTLNLEEYPNLTLLNCHHNNLTTLDLSKANGNMWYLNCHNNKITSLDITPLGDNLRNLYCGQQQINDEMSLILTDSQKEKWNSDWSVNDYDLNDSVRLVGVTVVAD